MLERMMGVHWMANENEVKSKRPVPSLSTKIDLKQGAPTTSKKLLIFL
jgi:hypothetical protein